MVDLKWELKNIQRAEYDFADWNLDQLTVSMINAIGSTDSELRESIYTTFVAIIHSQDLLNSHQLNRLKNICLDDQHLFCHLGEKDTDSVFVRAFSVLVIGLIIDAEQRQSLSSKEEFGHLKNQLFRYILKEKDNRGFVEGKGWAHSLAHTADTLIGIANHRHATVNDLIELLAVIKTKVLFSDSVYDSGEDERLALLVFHIVQRRILSDQQILNWISDFPFLLSEQLLSVSDARHLNLMLNVRNFLFCLYFRFKFEEIGTHLQKEIENTLDSIREF